MEGKHIMGGREKVKVAVVQASAVFMDKERTIDKACNLILEASRNGAELIVFSEAFIPGFPAYYTWGFESKPREWAAYMIALQDNSVVVGSRDTEVLGEAAKEAGAYVVIGCNELDDREGSQTVYNSLLFIGRDGRFIGRHRKLMPTYIERTYWGLGDASDLRVFTTDIGRLGGLICGEHTMVLLKAALIHQAEAFHISVWPGAWSARGREHLMEWIPEADPFGGGSFIYPLVKSYAIEAQAFVPTCCGILNEQDIPQEWKHLTSSDRMNYQWAVGGSVIVNPFGGITAGPVFGEETILYADCYANHIKVAKAMFDSLGHYARWDLVRLRVAKEPRSPYVGTAEAPRPALPLKELKRVAQECDISLDKLEGIIEELNRSASLEPTD